MPLPCPTGAGESGFDSWLWDNFFLSFFEFYLIAVTISLFTDLTIYLLFDEDLLYVLSLFAVERFEWRAMDARERGHALRCFGGGLVGS